MPGSAAIGLDVGGTQVKGGIVGPDGTVLVRVELPTEASAGTKTAIQVVEDLLALARDGGTEVSAIGVGAAGFVDASTGSITFAPNLVYDDPQIGSAIAARSSLPTVVDNDANVAAWGERTFGTARGADHVAMLTLGTGVGSGFVVGGRLLRGSTGAGAEFGHVVIDPNGPECPCGLRGCLEQFASGTAIARMAVEAVEEEPKSSIVDIAAGSRITAEHVAKAAREYDETARAVLRRAGTALGIGMSNIVNVFDPQVIVLGGSVVGAGEPYLGPARDTLNKMVAAQKRRPVRLDLTALGPDAGIVGAAALAMDPEAAVGT
jgi:glucokinase